MASSSKQPILSIDRFFTGLYTRRNPLFTPFRSVGINVVQFHDALIDGLDVELPRQLHPATQAGLSHLVQRKSGIERSPKGFLLGAESERNRIPADGRQLQAGYFLIVDRYDHSRQIHLGARLRRSRSEIPRTTPTEWT